MTKNRSDDLDKFPTNLSNLRKRHKMDQKELGKILNVSRATISLYETGKKKPSYNVLFFLGKHFKVSLNELMGIDPWIDIIEKKLVEEQ